MIINRIFEQANQWTFKMQSAMSLLQKYNVGPGWIDPFAGKTSPAGITNDLNPEMPTKYHLTAIDFIKQLEGLYQGIIFDPPYSLAQTKRCYENIGIEFMYDDTLRAVHWGNIKDIVKDKIKPGGYAICFGWNSSGLGMSRGFEIIEILLVNHGGNGKNDTIITVEQKINQGQLF